MKSFRVYLAAAAVIITSPVTLTHADDPPLVNEEPSNYGVSLILPSYVVVNDDDDQPLSHPDYEKWDMDHCPSAYEDDLQEVKVSATAGKVGGYLTLRILNGQEKITSVVTGTIFWADSWKYTAGTIPVALWLPAGTSYEASYWIEGNHNSDAFDDVRMQADFYTLGGQGSDGEYYLPVSSTSGVKKTTVVQADIDVDSNNNEGCSFAWGSKVEDEIETSQKPNVDGWPKRPGKLVVVNSGNTDGVPDWADGFNTNPDDTEDDLLNDGQADFVEVLVERKDPFTDDCEVKFEYEASDPLTVATITKDADWNPEHPYAYTLGENGKLRLWTKASASARNSLDAPPGDYLPNNTWIKWSDLNGCSGAVTKKLYLEAVRPSVSLGDLSIKVTMRQSQETGESVQATDTVLLTNFEFSSEPVNSSDESPLRGHMEEPTNPAGVSGGYYAGYFEVAVKPENYPDDKIVWNTTGAWSTSATNGRFKIISGGAQTAPGKATLDIEGIYTPDPEFNGQSLTLKTIGAKCVVIRDSDGNNPAISGDAIDELLTKVNTIWRQAGIIFARQGAVSYIDNSFYRDGLSDSETTEIISTYDVSDNMVEIYFVPRIDGSTLGVDYISPTKSQANGLIIACGPPESPSDPVELVKTTAHELGHALYLDDIYWKDSGRPPNSPPGTEVSYRIPDGIPTAVDKTPDDWNGAYWVAPRYYPQDITHRDILKRLLMNGWADDSIGQYPDIPNGTIHGCTHDDYGDGPVDVYEGQVDVGLKTLLEHGRTSHH